ncbi:MAG: hypothetical protein WAM85_06970 [Terracidiphilus sp.]
MLIGLALTLTPFAPRAGAQTQPADQKPAEPKPAPETYQTFYLSNMTQINDANDIQTDLRNMLPKSRLYYMPSQGAISMRGSSEDFQLAQKILADLDRPRKIYRVTYTITDMDNGKRTATQHLALIVVSGAKTILKQGSRVPIVTGTYDQASTNQNSQVQYQDIGLSIEASLDGYADGLRLRSKVEQSSLADEKSGLGVQDPVIRQTVLEGMSTLAPGKPLVLGSLDVPGTTRRQEIEVVSELVQ